MKQRHEQDRRQSQAVFYDAISDRRCQDRREQEPVPAKPGSIRPAPGEPMIERRRFPEAGSE
jgi:hypothetical protein